MILKRDVLYCSGKNRNQHVHLIFSDPVERKSGLEILCEDSLIEYKKKNLVSKETF